MAAGHLRRWPLQRAFSTPWQSRSHSLDPKPPAKEAYGLRLNSARYRLNTNSMEAVEVFFSSG